MKKNNIIQSNFNENEEWIFERVKLKKEKKIVTDPRDQRIHKPQSSMENRPKIINDDQSDSRNENMIDTIALVISLENVFQFGHAVQEIIKVSANTVESIISNRQPFEQTEVAKWKMEKKKLIRQNTVRLRLFGL